MASKINNQLHEPFQTIQLALWGDPAATSLEQRILNTIVLLAAVASLLALIYNVFWDYPFVQIIISALCLVVNTGAYAYSRITNRWRQLAPGLYVFFLIALSLAWIYTHGSRGSIPYYFFLLFTATILLLERKVRLASIFIMLFSIGMLFYTEQAWPDLIKPYDNDAQRFFDVTITLFICLGINGAIIYIVFAHYLKERNQKDLLLEQAMLARQEIESAFSEIKVLRGYLPICSSCKKIRDDKGYWNQIEVYIRDHSEAEFSHGICPECKEKLYPDL